MMLSILLFATEGIKSLNSISHTSGLKKVYVKDERGRVSDIPKKITCLDKKTFFRHGFLVLGSPSRTRVLTQLVDILQQSSR